MNSDFKDLLSIFNETGVRYLVIGGYALPITLNPAIQKI